MEPGTGTMIFGEPWGAPVCSGATRLPEVPTYAVCLRCEEQLAEGDQGFLRPTLGGVDAKFIVGGGNGFMLTAIHRECDLVDVLGHLVGVCGCTGWDTQARATGREVLRRLTDGAVLRALVDGDGDGVPGGGGVAVVVHAGRDGRGVSCSAAVEVDDGVPFARPPTSGDVVCRGCAMKLARALLATGLDYAVHERGTGYVVCWDDDPALPVIGGAHRRLTMSNRAEMIAWCGGREAGDELGVVGGVVLRPLLSEGPYTPVARPGDVIERLGPDEFRVLRASEHTG